MRVIYLIDSHLTKRAYIGQSAEPKRRWYGHKYSAKRGVKGPLYDAMRKHGVDAFSFTILEVHAVDVEQCVIDQRERELIRQHQTLFPDGYNVAPGGFGHVGTKHSDERKAQISAQKQQLMSDPRFKRSRHTCVTRQQFEEREQKRKEKQRRRIPAFRAYRVWKKFLAGNAPPPYPPEFQGL